MEKNNYEKGLYGQHAAEKLLQNKGYQIRDKNYRIKSGEIDIIAQVGNTIIFVEVKYRRGLRFGYPREAVGHAKQQKILRTALYYISRHGFEHHDFRFDVIEVLEDNGQTTINHIENAFDV